MSATQLKRPLQQSQAPAVLKELLSNELNYPNFKLLNNLKRVRLSPDPLRDVDDSRVYRLLAIANSKGWFASAVAARNASSVTFSPLADLRVAFMSSEDETNVNLLDPKRTLTLPTARVNLINFTENENKMVLGLDQGSILIYDTSKLFSPGSNQVSPEYEFQSSNVPTQIVPNPSNAPGLAELAAVLRENGEVDLIDTQKMLITEGWRGEGLDVPKSLSWSPKGKHLALGLHSGDILTYSPSERGTHQKHIPSTSGEPLVYINWLGPGHAFHVVTCQAESNINPTHSIVSLESQVVATRLAAPWPTRSSPGSFDIILPSLSLHEPNSRGLGNIESKSALLIVGDISSVDLEVFGKVGSEWHQRSSETPLSLPFDQKEDDKETTLVALDVDLTSVEPFHTSNGDLPPPPILYAYLNDGTIQGWYIVHDTAYPGMVATSALSEPSNQNLFSRTNMTIDSSSPAASAFGQPLVAASPFVQSSGGSASGFGQSSITFGQPPTLSSSSTSAANQHPQPVSAFGTSSAFGQAKSSPSPFGQPTSSAFGQLSAPSAYVQSPFVQSSFSNPSAYGITNSNTTSAAPSSGGFSAFASASPAKFGQTGYDPGPAPSTLTASVEEPMMGAESASSLGSLSLGGSLDSQPRSAFGIFGPASSSVPPTPANTINQLVAPGPASGSSLIKPATGFGAFGNNGQTQTTQATSTGGEQGKPSSVFGTRGSQTTTPPHSAFGQPSFGQPAFGKPAFGQPSFGQPSFGQPSFGQPSFGQPSAGQPSFGKSSFGKSSFGQPSPNLSTTPTSSPASGGGFSAFAQGGSATFGSALKSNESEATKPAWATSSTTPAATEVKPTGDAATTKSAFSISSPNSSSPFAPAPASSAFASARSSPESVGNARSPSPLAKDDSPPPSPTPFKSRAPAPSTGAFGQLQTSSSGFKPSTGFGAFTNVATPFSSPFFNPPKANTTTPPVSAFANLGTSPAPPSASAFAASKPTFGAPSALGGTKSAFTAAPATPMPAKQVAPSSGGFSAFSGSASGFSAFAKSGPRKSFGELLKGGGDDAKDPEKPNTQTPTSQPTTMTEGKGKAPVSVFALPTAASEPVLAKTDRPKDNPHDKQTTDDSFALNKGKGSAPASPLAKPAPSAPEPVQKGKSTKTIKSKAEPSESNISNPDESSFGSLSLSSQTSSFVEVTASEVPTGSDGESDNGDVDNDETLQDDEDDAQSFLSESLSGDSEGSEGSYDEEHEEEEQEEYVDDEEGEGEDDGENDGEREREPEDPVQSSSPEPTKIPLPLSRSPSATPQPTTPVSLAIPMEQPPAADRSESSPILSIVTPADASTTPPGSPAKEMSPAIFKLPLSAPSPSPAQPASSNSTSLGLGRPSTRPTRSSPLAMAPVSRLDESDDPSSPPHKSAPLLKPHPASPKPAFGLWSGKTTKTEETETAEAKASRPKTPPLLTTFGTPLPQLPLSAPNVKSNNFPLPNTTANGSIAPVSASGSRNNISTPPLAAWPSKAPETSISTPLPPLSLPSLNKTSASSVPNATPSSAPVNKLGALQAPAFFDKSAVPQSATSSSNSPVYSDDAKSTVLGLNSQTSATSTPSSFFSTPSTPLISRISSTTASGPLPPTSVGVQALPATSVQSLKAEPSVEQGMQAECAYLFASLARELEELRLLAQNASRQRAELGKSAGGSHSTADLAVATKWGLSDIVLYGQTMKQIMKDIDELKEQRSSQANLLQELESSMLKAGTRKEEIARFNKANADTEFVKMLKVRTLGPEHLETQTQLRRNIRAIRERIQTLEDYLQVSKRRLNEIATGKPGFKAPSLDTINRTYRNIDIAINQQHEEIAQLTSRVSKLKFSSSLRLERSRDARLPDPVTKRPFNVTPHVAVTTAAALNAERSALKLKRALLAIRQEPLKNVTAAVTAAPVAFDTPHKSALFPNTPTTPSLEWSLPDDEFRVGELLPSRRSGGSGKQKHRSVPLKKPPATYQQSSTASTAKFEWGPLPSFNTPSRGATLIPIDAKP